MLGLASWERNVPCKRLDSLQGTSTVAEVVLPAGPSDEESREQETLLGTFSIHVIRWRII